MLLTHFQVHFGPGAARKKLSRELDSWGNLGGFFWGDHLAVSLGGLVPRLKRDAEA